MGITIASNFSPRFNKPLDDRTQFSTILDMKNFATASLSDGLIAYNLETKKHYVYSSENPEDVSLGKWRELESGGGDTIQVSELPTASVENLGKIYEYVGETTEDYTNGFFYQCVQGETVETSVEFTPHTGVETVVSISPEDFQAFIEQWCEGRSFTAAEVTHGDIGYFSSDRYSMAIYTDVSGQFAYASFTIAELEEAGFSFSPYLSAQQGVDFTCTIAHTPYYWIQKNVQPSGGDTIQVEVLPEPIAENEGQIVEYIGDTQSGSTFRVVNTETTNPVTVDLNKNTFETLIIENFGEEYLDTIAQAPITLNYNYFEQAEQNAWGLYFGERLVAALPTSELPILGVTVTYTEGHEEVNDTITLQYSVGANVINGYFYQSSRKPIPSSFYADVTTGSDYYVDYTSLDTYEDYIVNTLHEQLQDKTYNFTYKTLGYLPDNSSVDIINPGRDFVEGTYHMAGWDLEFHLYVDERGSVTNIEITGGLQSAPTYNMPVTSNNLYDLTTGTDLSFTFDYAKPVQFWTLDNSPVNLDNYGIELYYNNVEVVIPAALDIDAETYTQDPATFSCDVNTFISSYESMTGRTPEEDMRIGFKGTYGQGWWEGNYTQRSYTDAEMASIWGVTITWTSGGQVQDGDSVAINFKAQRTEYEPAQPQDNDVITAEYTAQSFVRAWLPKKVQDDGYKIDKFKLFPEATEENLGLIAQYVGETEEYESDILVHDIQSEDANVSVDIDKTQFEQAIIHAGGEEALSYYMDFRFEWDSNDRAWKCFRNIEHQGEEQIGELSTNELESFGMYVTVDPSEDTLYRGIISFSYIPKREGGFHNGYFYESTKVENEESFNIENIEQLALDYSNPYELSIDTYRDYIESRGQELQSTYYNLHYATERPTSRTSGWYDENTHEEYELSDLGVILNYATLGEINTSSSTICTQESFTDSRFFIDKIDNTRIEQVLDAYRIDYRNLTNSISIVFTCIDGSNNKWQYNIAKDSILSTGNPEDFNIDIQQREPQRAWQFTTGDTFTLVYSPAYDQSKSSSDYFVIGNYFQNYFGAYIDSVDIDTFESYIGTLPTTAILYKWECVSNDPSVEWTLNGVSANPSDYGLNLHQNRAPAYNVGDTVTMMYVPNRDDAFAIVYSDLTGTGSVTSLDKETFISKWGSIPQNNTSLNFYCTDAGDYITSKWLNFFDSADLSGWGVNLDQIQDQNAYKVGDRIIVMYFAQPRMEIAQPNDYSRFTLDYTANEQYYEWVQKDVQPSSQSVVDYNELENKPAINGVELNSETTTTDLGLMDLSTDQTANGTKIIDELYKSGEASQLQAIEVNVSGNEASVWTNLSFIPRDENTVFAFGALSARDVGTISLYRQDTKSYPAFGIINKSTGSLVRDNIYPLNADPNMIATTYVNQYGWLTSDILGGFCSNVVEWIDTQDNNKRWLFVISSPCILAKIDPDKLNPDEYQHAVVASYSLYNFGEYVNNKTMLDRLRVQGDFIYAFGELSNGTTGKVYPVKFDIYGGWSEALGNNYPGSASGYGNNIWGRNVDKDSGFDFQIITQNGVDYAYLYAVMSEVNEANPFYDINGNRIEYPRGTIFRFPLDNSRYGDNLEYMGYQFNDNNDHKCEILNILKLNERYLLVYSYGDPFTYLNLFDCSSNQVVARISGKFKDFSDDYSVYKQSEDVYVVSGFAGENIYQVTIDLNTQSFHEHDNEFVHPSAYTRIMHDVTNFLDSQDTIYTWDNVDLIVNENGEYYFRTPVIYTIKQISSGEKYQLTWMGTFSNLDRYATESYVDSVITTTIPQIQVDIANSINALENRIHYNYGMVSYDNLLNKPSLNGRTISGAMNSRYYNIIEDYGINITDTQMIMNDKGIKYDTPFQVATVIAGGGSEYSSFEIKYVIPSNTENNIYYQVANYRYNGNNTDYCGVFRYNANINEREIIVGDFQGKYISGSYNSSIDRLTLLRAWTNGFEDQIILHYIRNLSESEPTRTQYYSIAVDYSSGRWANYGSYEDIVGLFIDNDSFTSIGSDYSGYTDNAQLYVHNIEQHRTYNILTWLYQQSLTPNYFEQGKFSQSYEEFKSMGDNIGRNTYLNGVTLYTPVRKGEYWCKIDETDLGGVNPDYLLTNDDINNGLLGISMVGNWDQYFPVAYALNPERTEFSTGQVWGMVVPMVRAFVDDIQVYNFTVEPNGSNTYKLVFDSPIASGSVVKVQVNKNPSGIGIQYDGTDWNLISNVAIVPEYYESEYSHTPLEIDYRYLITTDDPTNHFIIVGTVLDTDIQVQVPWKFVYSTSSDGETWTPISIPVVSSEDKLVDVKYLDGVVYFMLSDGSIFYYDVTNMRPLGTMIVPNRSGRICAAESYNGKLYVVEQYYYFELSSKHTLKTHIYDKQSNTWTETVENTEITTQDSYLTVAQVTLKHDGKKFNLFVHSGYIRNWCVSEDCEYWKDSYSGINTDHYYNERVPEYGFDVDPKCIGTDLQGGLYLRSFNYVRSNGAGLYYQASFDTLVVDGKSSDSYISTYYEPVPTKIQSNIRIDSNNTLLSNDLTCYGVIASDYISKSMDSQDISNYSLYCHNYIMKGNNNKVYLAPTFNINEDNSRDNFTKNTPSISNRGTQKGVLEQPWGMGFLYILNDNYAEYVSSYKNTISAASVLNGYGNIPTGHPVFLTPDREGYARFRYGLFKVMPTYRITSVHSTSSSGTGTGYQVGEEFSIGGIIEAGETPTTNYARCRITGVNGNGGVTSFEVLSGGCYLEDPEAYSSNNLYMYDYSGSGTGVTFFLRAEIIEGPHNGEWTFGNLSVKPLDIITPDINNQDTWKKFNTSVTDDDLLELRGSFENEGGITKIEAIDSHYCENDRDLSKFYFYCLITTGDGVVKAYRSQDISIFNSNRNVQMMEVSVDLSEATQSTEYSISYLAQHAFIYSPDNFYITTPAFVNFKGRITDLYDTNFMELYTTHPTSGFVVPALSNKNFRHTFTKNSDFKPYYYNFKDIVQLGENWEAGIHQITTVFDTTDGDLEATVLFETDSLGRLKQVFSITPELGNYTLNTNTVTIENPNGTTSTDNIVLLFETIDLNNTSFIPSIEKYGIVKRGYRVQNSIDPTDPANTNSIATVEAIIQYVQSLLS